MAGEQGRGKVATNTVDGRTRRELELLGAAAYDSLGLVAIQRGDFGAARRGFEKAPEVNPNERKALLDLGILHQKIGNNEQALHYL